MPDEFMNPEVPPNSVPQGDGPVAAAKTGGNKTLFIVIGAIALLAVVVGIAAAVVVFVIGGAPDEATITTGTSPQPTTGASVTTTAAPVAAGPAESVANDEVFTFRDIFAPLAGALPSTTSTSTTTPGSTDTPVDTSEYAADTLYLLAIQVDDGVSKAQMVWNQQELLLSEGDVISGTPWKVLEIRTSDVVMLYGDQQVVLSVGQGISK